MSRRLVEPSAYFREDTIAAIATGLGGAIAIVRVSGPAAVAAARRVTDAKFDASDVGRLRRCRVLRRDGQPLDSAMGVHFLGPKSHTGEDVVELQVHGASYLSERIIEELQAAGVRQALPGEFSFRAVKNGKMTLGQAQGVADLMDAMNDGALGLALDALSGAQAGWVHELAERLRQTATLAEVSLDFSDQDVPELGLPGLKARLAAEIAMLRGLEEGFARGVRIREGVRLAIVGLPNAGKSSLFNAVLGEDRSIVSEIPGTTRDLVHERFTLRSRESGESVTFRLEDTAGIRAGKSDAHADPVERVGMERAREAARSADLILWVVDAESNADELAALWKKLEEGPGAREGRILGVLSKVDAVPERARRSFLESTLGRAISEWRVVSSRTGEGMEALCEAIVARAKRWVARAPKEVLLTRIEHQRAVAAARETLERARDAEDTVLFAADVRQALRALNPLLGETLTDDLLERVFSQFCIGK